MQQQQRPALKRQRSFYQPQPYKKQKTNVSLINPPSSNRRLTEKKNLDVDFRTLTIPISQGFSAPSFLNACIQGTGPTQRIGRKVLFKSIVVRWIFSGAATHGTTARILVVYDKSPNNAVAAPAAIDILTGAADVTSGMNLTNSERFIVIADEYTASTDNGGNLGGKIYRKLNLDAIYDGTVASPGTIQAVTTGSFLILVASSDATAPAFSFSSRLRFVDY